MKKKDKEYFQLLKKLLQNENICFVITSDYNIFAMHRIIYQLVKHIKL